MYSTAGFDKKIIQRLFCGGVAIRMPAEWMNPADDRILEYLDSEDSAPPSIIVKNDKITYGITHITKRLGVLSKGKLVEEIGNGVYRITPKGRAYLAGQEDLRDVERPD